MKTDNYFDDQALGSFVDGQLDAAHSEVIIRAMEDNPEIRERVYQFRRAKDLIWLGFGEARAPSSKTAKAKLRGWKLFSTEIAASVAALAIAFGAGMYGHWYYAGPMNGFVGQAVASSSQHQSEKVILHVSESDPEQFAAALNYTEKFLHEHQGDEYQIDVVAHAGGIDMMRADVSPVKIQMLEMIAKYDNVHLIGCANAIRMLRKKGIEPPIISGVSTDSTAFDHIVDRLQGGGWKYIKVKTLSEI